MQLSGTPIAHPPDANPAGLLEGPPMNPPKANDLQHRLN
jgi:hypothetical protein